MQDPVQLTTAREPAPAQPDQASGRLRQHLLARMGIPSWQLRRPALLAGHQVAPTPANEIPASEQAAAPASAVPSEPPSGKLWILASRLPAPGLLADLCQLLGIGSDEVSLLSSLPVGHTPPLLWLEAADPAWPEALICPLAPSPAQKRALWQQLKGRLG
ncbi:DNA polymerase III subunit psi [Aeromonas hydrophila]|uniref:DNA polymerase III subunit psi n=1 Tax=Aeromonas hydrophila TaxID=644 RepID=UPI000954A2E2|nr:DNA polymerase III subunit psi [Aeromonas hydrophila]MCV3277603.1 DNA polymerase III subunit psi [Aeromonas hydrophila]WAG14997.1 DNA polymerase III subunit psi [Aeromonas hydrophila]SIQ78659.1 DNA polymerase III, psi subunit [Aeromonas hydrophila]SIQ79348.1 DNA polymerase III, psi subunit [Aeromonas hydrophila]